jgi:hypothetical protein
MRWVIRTAFGAPLVPEVKISMKVASSVVSPAPVTTDGCRLQRAVQSGASVSITRTWGRSKPERSAR